MGYKAVEWAYAQTVGNASAKSVLVALAEHADASGRCFPSKQRIATMTETSRATVARALALLEAQELIKRSRRVRANGSDTSSWITLRMSHSETPGGSERDGRGAHSETPITVTSNRSIEPTPGVGEGKGSEHLTAERLAAICNKRGSNIDQEAAQVVAAARIGLALTVIDEVIGSMAQMSSRPNFPRAAWPLLQRRATQTGVRLPEKWQDADAFAPVVPLYHRPLLEAHK